MGVSYDEAQGLAFQQDVLAAYRQAGQTPDVANVAWSNRMTYDAWSGGYAWARDKHLQELRQALGLPFTPWQTQPNLAPVGYDEAQGIAFQANVLFEYQRAGQPADVANVVWSNRMVWDAASIGYAISRAKHLRELDAALGLIPPAPPLPAPPTRDQILRGRTTQQGLMIDSLVYGMMPWWGACWAWLTPEDRAHIAPQLLAHGDTICLIHSALDGKPLYDEPGQFYSPDKFGPLQLSLDEHAALCAEAIALGFAGVLFFLDGDDGQQGFPIAMAETQALGPVFSSYSGGNLHEFVAQIPGWDGVWHKPNPTSGTGYTPQQIAAFAAAARAAGAIYLAIEHGTGYILAGEGGQDYEPGGVMTGYDIILGEFNDAAFDDDVWQLLGRYLGQAYVRPPEQPADDDPHPPFVLAPGSPRGWYAYWVFEYFIYGFVRGATPEMVATSTSKFKAMGAPLIC